MKDADEAVGEGAQGPVVGVARGSALVVERTGAGAGGEGGEGPLVGGVWLGASTRSWPRCTGCRWWSGERITPRPCAWWQHVWLSERGRPWPEISPTSSATSTAPRCRPPRPGASSPSATTFPRRSAGAAAAATTGERGRPLKECSKHTDEPDAFRRRQPRRPSPPHHLRLGSSGGQGLAPEDQFRLTLTRPCSEPRATAEPADRGRHHEPWSPWSRPELALDKDCLNRLTQFHRTVIPAVPCRPGAATGRRRGGRGGTPPGS